MTEYEKEYNEFWKDIVETDGVLDMDKIKRELFDFSVMISNVSLVYDHITRSRISKPLAKAKSVIEVHDEIRQSEIDEALDEFKESLL